LLAEAALPSVAEACMTCDYQQLISKVEWIAFFARSGNALTQQQSLPCPSWATLVSGVSLTP
jgi:hypothetical protein